MKTISILLALLASIYYSSAQKVSHFEIGASAGASINSAFQVPRNSSLRMKWDAKLHPAVYLSVAYTSINWQYGVIVGYNSVSCNLSDIMGTVVYQLNGSSIYGMPDLSITPTGNISYTYLPVKLFINRTFPMGKAQLYGGLSAGAAVPLYTSNLSDVRTRKYYSIGTQTNITAGLQTGVSIPMSKVVAFNASIEANFVNINAGHYVYAFPVIVGVRCKL